ncbi:MAG: DUF2961 domain-containing protein, partial [Planctomycetes bacterium]|nr:DUF2961 domain-containing protein [Planctomycetota bacterium]
MLRPILLWGISICLAGSSAFAQSVTMESLLDEMVNREAIARYPSPTYTCRQASSYDRDSVAPDKPGWFANWDRSQFVRVEERQGHKEYVLMDVDGPGAVVRFWATWHGPGGGEFTNGTLRVFLDQDPRPAIEGPISEVLDGGKLVGPPLSEGVSPETEYRYRGHNLYLPIPYANHCKVTYETAAPVDQGAKTGEALYYQINYRTYPQETRVESFDLARLRQLKSKIAEVQARLLQSGWETAKSLPATSFSGTIARGKSRSVDLNGPAAVRHVSLRLEAQDLPQALQSTVLEIEFDG